MREIITTPPDGPKHGVGMVAGVRAGDLIFYSAIRGNDRSNQWSPDTAVQAREAFEKLKELLAAAGATLDNVVKVTLYLHELKYRQAFHEVWMEYFPVNPPARIAIRVADANAGPGGNAHFALDVIAHAPKG